MKDKKAELKEDHYRKMVEYELEQIKLRDIEWMTGIQKRVIEKEESQKQWEEEKERRRLEREAEKEKRRLEKEEREEKKR